MPASAFNELAMLNTEPRRPALSQHSRGQALVSHGLGPIVSRADFFYINWFGGLVFATLAILGGIFTIGCALFKPTRLHPRGERQVEKVSS